MLCVVVYVCARVHVRGNMAVNVLKAAAAVPQMGVTTPSPYYANTNRLLIAMI
jgi:hypothetical protein